MQTETITVGAFQANCHVLVPEPGLALVVDPGAEAPRIRAFLDERELSVAAYLLTHGHADHLAALPDLARERPAPIVMHADDLEWAFSPLNQFPPFYAVPDRPDAPFRAVTGDQDWTGAGVTCRVIATAGHTSGSVCLHFRDHGILLSGDTLFAGSVGRTDLPGGDNRALGRSLRALAKLPADTCILTGHGPATDLDTEKRTNVFLSTPDL